MARTGWGQDTGQGWGRPTKPRWGGGNWRGSSQLKSPDPLKRGSHKELWGELSERARWLAEEEHLGDCYAIFDARYLINPQRNLAGIGAVTQVALAVAQHADPYPSIQLNRMARSSLSIVEGEPLSLPCPSRGELLQTVQEMMGPGLRADLRLGAVVDATFSFWDDGFLIERPSQEGDMELLDLTPWHELKELQMVTRSARHNGSDPRKAFTLISEKGERQEGKILAGERFLSLFKPHAREYGFKVVNYGSGGFEDGFEVSELWATQDRRREA